jgi:hypothetical protein
MDVVLGEQTPEIKDEEKITLSHSYSNREEEKRVREEIRKQKAEEREKKAEERRIKTEEREAFRIQREELKKQKEEEREKQLLNKRKREEDREEAKQQREEERARKEAERRKRSEELEAAKIQRDEVRKQKQEEVEGRLCKGDCGCYRSSNPPKSKVSRWFVCYGCKSYSLCLKCGAASVLRVNLFQEHAEKCDPYYNDRISQNSRVENMITALLPPPPVPSVTQQPIPSDDVEDDYEPDPYAMNLAAPARNLLSFYQPPPVVAVDYSYTSSKGCWTGDSRILKFDGTFVHARDIIPGDQLLSSTGSCAIVNAVIISSISNPVKIVQLSQHCSVTSGHPIFNTSIGDYVRADSLKPSSLSPINKLFNFELNRECEGLTCDAGIIGATVGKSFDLVRKLSSENDLIWGCNYWSTTQQKLQQSYFSNIQYLTKECSHTE